MFNLSRVDGKDIPKWKDVEHMPDGKHRLRYNPAAETKEISQEDFDSVRASGKRKTEAAKRNRFKRRGGDRAALARL